VPGTRAVAANTGKECGETSATDRRRSLTWAQRLKRVFAIDIEICRSCGGRLRVIASIEAPALIDRILEHLGRDAESADPAHPSRARPNNDGSDRLSQHGNLDRVAPPSSTRFSTRPNGFRR
jgi:hypothetical protein